VDVIFTRSACSNPVLFRALDESSGTELLLPPPQADNARQAMACVITIVECFNWKFMTHRSLFRIRLRGLRAAGEKNQSSPSLSLSLRRVKG